jgi:hypothetical protein
MSWLCWVVAQPVVWSLYQLSYPGFWYMFQYWTDSVVVQHQVTDVVCADHYIQRAASKARVGSLCRHSALTQGFQSSDNCFSFTAHFSPKKVLSQSEAVPKYMVNFLFGIVCVRSERFHTEQYEDFWRMSDRLTQLQLVV